MGSENLLKQRTYLPAGRDAVDSLKGEMLYNHLL